MKCLSIRQPWATLIAIGAKKFETRSWATNYRGPLAIHASKRWDWDMLFLSWGEPFRSALYSSGKLPVLQMNAPAGIVRPFPLGCIVAVTEVLDCWECEPTWTNHISEDQREFGDFSLGRFAWRLGPVTKLAKPIDFVGRQGLFDVPDDIIEQAVSP